MRRVLAGLIEGLIYVAIAALLLAVVIATTVHQRGWTRDTAQKVIAQELANALGMPVRLGPIEGDVWRGAIIRGLSVTGPDGRDVIIVEEAGVDWDLAAVVRGKPLVQTIRRITLTRPYVRVFQDETGKTNLQQLIRLIAKPLAKPAQAVPPWLVEVRDGMIEYDLRGPKLPERPMAGKVYNINASVDMRREGWVTGSAAARTNSALLGSFTMTMGLERPLGRVGVRLGFQRAGLPALVRLAKVQGKLQVSSGTADGEVAVYLAPGGKPEFTASFLGSGLSLNIPRIGGSVRAGTAQVRVTSHDLWASVPRMSFEGGSGDVEVTLSDFAKPVIDAEVSNARLYWPTLQKLALKNVKTAKVPKITAGWVTGKVAVMGPMDHLELDAQVVTAEAVVVTTEKQLTVAAAGAQIHAALHDASKPAIVFEATLRKPRAANLPAVRWEGQKAQPVVSGLGDLKVSGVMAGPIVATAQFTAARASISRIDARSVSGRAEVAWPVIHLAGVSLDAGGGKATGEVLIGADKTVAVNGRFHDVQGEWIRKAFMPKLNHEVRGVAEGQVAIRSMNKVTNVEILGKARDVEYQDYRARWAELELRWRSKSPVTIPWFVAQTAAGPASGEVMVDTSTKTFRVRYAAGPLDLGEAAKEAKVEGWSGTGWSQGTVAGAYETPQVSAVVALAHPGKEDQSADAAYAKIEGDMHELKVTDLAVAREGTVGTFSGELREVSREKPYADVSGTMKVKGIGIQRALKWVKLKTPQEDLPRGLAEMEATVSGTLAAPVLAGTVRAGPLAYKDYYATIVQGPFRFAGDKIDFGPADATVEGVPMNLTAAVSGLKTGGAPVGVTVVAKTGEFDLARVQMLQRKRIDVTGRAAIREAKIDWLGDKLQAATARVAVNEMKLGEVAFEPTTLEVRTEGNLVVLSPTPLVWPTGRLQVAGSYDTDRQTLAAEVKGEKVETGMLLTAAAGLAPAAMKEGEDLHKTVRQLESLGLRVVGPASGTVRIVGPLDDLEVDAHLERVALKLDGRKLPETTLSCVYVPKNGEFRDVDLEALYGQGLITARGSMVLDGAAKVTVDATAVDLRRLKEWVPSLPSMSGAVEVTAQFTGQTRKPDVKGSFDVTGFALSGAKLDLVQAPIFTIKEGAIRIEDGIVKRDQHEVKIAGALPFTWDGPRVPTDGPVALTAAMSEMNLDLLHTLVAEYYRSTYPSKALPKVLRAETSGTVDGTLDIVGTLAAPKISGGLALAKAGFKMPGWAHPVANIAAQMTLEPGGGGTKVSMAHLGGEYDKTAFAGGGEMVLRDLTKAQMLSNDWNLWATAASPEEAVAGGSKLKGLKVRVEAKNAGAGVVRVAVTEGQAQLGGGSVVVKGGVDLSELTWEKLADNHFDLSVALAKAQVKYADQLDGTVDGTLTVANPEAGKAAVVGGKLTLSKAQIAVKAPAGTTLELWGAPPSAPNFGLKVQVMLGPDVDIRGGGVEMPLEAGAQLAMLTGTMADPVVRGRVEALQGRATLPGGILSVRSLNVDLKVDPGAKKSAGGAKVLVYKADVTGQAEKVVSQVEVDGQILGPLHIYVGISGELPGTLSVTARSEPSLAEAQIYAILGAEPLGILPTGAASSGDALSERFVSLLEYGLRASVFQPVEAQLRALLGLSEFAVTFGVNQATEVRVGKYLVKNLLVSYQRSLGTGGLEDWWLSVSYEVAPGSVVSYYSRSDGEKRFMVGRQRTF